MGSRRDEVWYIVRDTLDFEVERFIEPTVEADLLENIAVAIWDNVEAATDQMMARELIWGGVVT